MVTLCDLPYPSCSKSFPKLRSTDIKDSVNTDFAEQGNSNLNSNRQLTSPSPLPSPLLEPIFHLDSPGPISLFDPKDPSDAMLIESYLPSLIQCSRLKKKCLAKPRLHCFPPSPFSSKFFFNTFSKPSKPRTYKLLKNIGSLTTITSTDSPSSSHSSSISSNFSHNMICNGNKWILLANSLFSPPYNPPITNPPCSLNTITYLCTNKHSPTDEEVRWTWEVGLHLGLTKDHLKEDIIQTLLKKISKEKDF